MKISRENYEIWFMDWIDNNLTGSQIMELNVFLDHNPDLRDEFNDLFVVNLRPAADSFKGKENLHRSSEKIPEKQFELICAASAENDLNEEQQKELNEITSHDPEKARILEIYKRLRLVAPELVFNNKKNLFRVTPTQKAIRIAWIGLSAAATVAILLMTGVLDQTTGIENRETIAINNTVRTPSPETIKSEVTDRTSADKKIASEQKTIKPESENKQESNVDPGKIEKESGPEKVINLGIQPVVIQHNFDYNLIASNIEIKPLPENVPADERSNIGRFISQRFRSKVLDEPLPSDKPLKGYEIAEAGIEGLNKLLGWDMALTTQNDENGEVKSLNFNSRMLKFNTPVKNNGSSE